MTHSTPPLSCRLTSCLDQIAGLALAVQEWGEQQGIPSRTIDHINLMLDEIITNIVTHGYDNAPNEHIDVMLRHNKNVVSMTITDWAKAFDITQVAPPNLTTNLDERKPGGVGIHIVRQLASKTTYERRGNMNILRLQKHFD